MDAFGPKSVSGGNQESQGSDPMSFDTTTYLANTSKTAEEIAQIQERVLQERSRVDQKIFDDRNAANREWRRLHEEGASARHEDFQQTLEALGETEERKEEFIRKQEEETARLKDESTKKRLELEREAQRQNEATERSTAEAIGKIKAKERREAEKVQKELRTKKKDAQKEIQKISKQYQEEMDETISNQMDEIEKMKAEGQRRLEEEKRKREKIARENASGFSGIKNALYNKTIGKLGSTSQVGTSSGHFSGQGYESIGGNAAAEGYFRGELPDDESSRSSSKVLIIVAVGLLTIFVVGFSIYKYTKSESEK